MKAFRTKPVHQNVNLTLPQFHFLKKIKNFGFEGYFHLSERSRYTEFTTYQDIPIPGDTLESVYTGKKSQFFAVL